MRRGVMQNKVRTFVAVEVSGEVAAKARQMIGLLAKCPASVKWVEPRNLHFTLKFLGDVDMLDVPAVCQAVAEAAADYPPFDLETRGLGAFPSPERPRTVWLGVGQGGDEMARLFDRVDAALHRIGFPKEPRRFTPHLTIGRVRDSSHGVAELARLIEEHRDDYAGLNDVCEVVVFSSELNREGPMHEPLSHAELGGR